jgi:hypothetical protein
MIKNYTSEVSAIKSIQHIENRLIEYGAKSVLKICENGKTIGIGFVIEINKNDIPFRFRARVKEVTEKFAKKIKKPQKGTLENVKAQAERTAWKIMADDVDIQLSLIEIDQKDFVEAFLSSVYNYKEDRTFFEKVKDNNFAQLEYKK